MVFFPSAPASLVARLLAIFWRGFLRLPGNRQGRITIVQWHQRISFHSSKSPDLTVAKKESEEQDGKNDTEQRGQQQDFHGIDKRLERTKNKSETSRS